MELLPRLLWFGRPRRCYCWCRRRRGGGVLRWRASLSPEEVVADDVVDDLFQQLPDQHAHGGLAEAGAFVAVLVRRAASPRFVVAIPAAVPATLRLPLLRVPACRVSQCLLSETPGDIASFASWSQRGSCLPRPRAAG